MFDLCMQKISQQPSDMRSARLAWAYAFRRMLRKEAFIRQSFGHIVEKLMDPGPLGKSLQPHADTVYSLRTDKKLDMGALEAVI